RVAVDIRHDDREVVVRVVAGGVVGQRVAVADRARRIDGGNGQRPEGTGDRLTDGADGSAIDGDGRRAIAGRERNGSGRRLGGVAIGTGRSFLAGALGLAATRRQAGLVDNMAGLVAGRHLHRGRVVADVDGERRRRWIAITVGQGVGENVADAAGRTRVAGVAIAA